MGLATKTTVNNYLKIFRVRELTVEGQNGANGAVPPIALSSTLPGEDKFVFFNDLFVANVVRAYAQARNHSIAFQGRGVEYKIAVYRECDGLAPEIPVIGHLFPVFTPPLPDVA
jgi:hypothetical protein